MIVDMISDSAVHCTQNEYSLKGKDCKTSSKPNRLVFLPEPGGHEKHLKQSSLTVPCPNLYLFSPQKGFGGGQLAFKRAYLEEALLKPLSGLMEGVLPKAQRRAMSAPSAKSQIVARPHAAVP